MLHNSLNLPKFSPSIISSFHPFKILLAIQSSFHPSKIRHPDGPSKNNSRILIHPTLFLLPSKLLQSKFWPSFPFHLLISCIRIFLASHPNGWRSKRL